MEDDSRMYIQYNAFFLSRANNSFHPDHLLIVSKGIAAIMMYLSCLSDKAMSNRTLVGFVPQFVSNMQSWEFVQCASKNKCLSFFN